MRYAHTPRPLPLTPAGAPRMGSTAELVVRVAKCDEDAIMPSAGTTRNQEQENDDLAFVWSNYKAHGGHANQ